MRLKHGFRYEFRSDLLSLQERAMRFKLTYVLELEKKPVSTRSWAVDKIS